MIFRTPEPSPEELSVIARIQEIRKGMNWSLQTQTRWTGFLRRNQIARAIQGSNTIEGYDVTFDDAVAVVEGEEIDTLTETRLALHGYREALSYILRLSDDKHFIFNEELIRSLHYMMLSYAPTKHPGQWRPGPIFVRREPSGERVYEGPDADMVPGLMRELVLELQRADDHLPVIVKAAMAHLNLVMIHPFKDGNGRMGRAIQTFVLATDGVLNPAFSSIEEYLGSRGNTEAYYAILAEVGMGNWHPERDARPWVRFCLQAHLQQAMTVARRAREIARLWNDLEEELRRRGLDDRMLTAVYEAAYGLRVRSSRYRLQAEVSSQVASRDLRVLVDQGLLQPQGEKKGRFYVASPYLRDIRDRNREIKIPAPQIPNGQLNIGL
jgi:Fic family protein